MPWPADYWESALLSSWPRPCSCLALWGVVMSSCWRGRVRLWAHKQLVGACLLIALLGGVFALAEAIRKGALRALLLNVFYMMSRWWSPDRRNLAPTLVPPARMTIPYGVPIAVGALAWWFWGGNVI